MARLSPDEENFLGKIPDDKMVVIKPFDPEIPEIAEEITEKVHSAVPELPVRHMGASALGISGQGDIDLYILCDKDDYGKYLLKLESVFGSRDKKSIIEWSFHTRGHDVEMYLTDPISEAMLKQIKVFETLKNNLALLAEYEKLKEEMNGKSFREYQRKKYEFYHRILGN